jgi:hypothetical protein
MDEFEIHASAIDVEDLMNQIRVRLSEKRGADYTAEEIRALAAVKLQRFADPAAVRSELLAQFMASRKPLPTVPDSLFGARRPIIAKIRTLLRPVLRLFFNPVPLAEMITAVNEISTTTTVQSALYYELLHNLVVELTRTSMEVKNLQMRVDSLTGRLESSERRARALESVVQYRESESVPDDGSSGEGPGTRSRRRRARRGRRGRGSIAAAIGQPDAGSPTAAADTGDLPPHDPDRSGHSK